MNPIRQPARRIVQPLLRRPQRRHKSIAGRQDSSTGHADSAGAYQPTSHPPHPEPVNESLGRGFYLTLALIPLSFAIYKFSRSSSSIDPDHSTPETAPWLTKMIHKFDYWRAEDERRNTMHTAMIEQAAHDRHLFIGMADEAKKKGRIVELRFPDIFSTGSPYNVPAGSQANLDELMAHYKAEANAAQAKRERKARAIYEGRESEEGRFPDQGRVKPDVIPGGSTY